VIGLDVSAPDGRVLHVYDSGQTTSEAIVYWQHGGGMCGLPPPPLVERAGELGLRVLGHDRPGYGGSTAQPGRSVADGAGDMATVLDRLGVESAITIGLSAGAMHALGAVALHPSRFTAAAVLGGPAPYGAAGLDWFTGMAEGNRVEFEAALRGRDALAAHLASDATFDLNMFAPEDLQAMQGPYWDWQLAAAGSVLPEGSIEDELACLSDWGFGLGDITVPVLVLHGAGDTFVPAGHAAWVAAAIPAGVLHLEPGGHISTIPRSEDALVWLRAHGGQARGSDSP
jgi:pimeloyl-ACP methyl ester carboxylesterase